MRSVAIGIYVAIFISFLRKVVRKACRNTRHAAAHKVKKFRLPDFGYRIVADITWDKGLSSPSFHSSITFHHLPSWLNEEESQSVADMLNNPSSRIFTEANINTLMRGLPYRCTLVHFVIRKAALANLYICYDMPDELRSAINTCHCDLENDIDDMVNAFAEKLPDETDAY